MTIKQKAKAYDKGIEKLREFYRDYDTVSCLIDVKEELANIFPELKESEDENWIPKEIIKYLKEKGDFRSCWLAWLEKQSHDGKKWIYEDDYYRDREQLYQDGIDDVLENPQKYGLEKQGEQKPADKVEPKFHEGEWLCENEPNNYARFIQILETVNVQGNERYRISRDIHNDEDIVEFDFVEKYYHKFGIQDAKDGDVLNSVRVKATIIFKNFNPDGKHINAYCALQQGFLIKQELPWDRDFDPATKKRRELLFQKMKEEGYEWDAEKKELKKIEQKPAEEYNDEDYGIDGLYHAQEILERTLGKVDGYQSDDGILEHKCAITAVKKLYEHKSAEWSEEDEKHLQSIISILTIKDEERYMLTFGLNSLYKRQSQIRWLKSLKPQNHWKPTEEQMEAIRIAAEVGTANDSWAMDILKKIYNQLKLELKGVHNNEKEEI